jgi:DNA-binding GntR family transcriptional regulator
MTEDEKRLSHLAGIQGQNLRLDRNLLKDRAAEMLRDQISSGRIPEGTKLTEREVSRLLGISRMPARDALMTLEAEGLILAKPDGRYVIELSEKDICDLSVLRWTLEGLAARLAAENGSAESHTALQARLDDLAAVADGGDLAECTRCDMALHETIWRQAQNPHLLRVLDSVLGAIFVLCDRVKVSSTYDAETTVGQHRRIVDRIVAGDGEGAAQAMEAHLRSALDASLRIISKV